ncbi:hypothetical protein [Hymenobacter elongatus]|uniref:Uncharacterized protein n=1 Tax=Hymenobacter elongatus TaxID=877208 RepID=A0A4Z0PMB6_9BACT|nr:hypothetical protein [Hymenobacter elongatus]TGE17398.1 hypothetical protein E5J99_07515 [Hymenobacter elongatus]
MKTPVLLVLTFFFRAADRALDYTTRRAGPPGARLVVLHATRDSALRPRAGRDMSVLVVTEVGRLEVVCDPEVRARRAANKRGDAGAGHFKKALIIFGQPPPREHLPVHRPAPSAGARASALPGIAIGLTHL